MRSLLGFTQNIASAQEDYGVTVSLTLLHGMHTLVYLILFQGFITTTGWCSFNDFVLLLPALVLHTCRIHFYM